MPSAFPLDELPPELHTLIVSHMYALCKSMTVRQLCVLRLVNIRMAQAFYKRCIMLILSRRYTPFLFPLGRCKEEDECFFYPLHEYFPAPTLLPQRRIHVPNTRAVRELMRVTLYEEQGQTLPDYKKCKQDFNWLMLCQSLENNRELMRASPEAREERLEVHRKQICVHLHLQEMQLFGLHERPTTRPKAMDPHRAEGLIHAVGINHTAEWGRFAWM